MEYQKEKTKNAILFFAKKGGSDVGKKKLAKLLYLTDFTLYELRKKALTGIPYVRKQYGPMPEPRTFYSILESLKKERFIKIETSDGIFLEKIVALKEPNMQVFDEREVKMLERIAEKHRLDTGGSLEKLAQSEPPYKMVLQGEKIPYHLAFYRNSFGEMDLAEDD